MSARLTAIFIMISLFYTGNSPASVPQHRKDSLLEGLGKEPDVIKRFSLLCELSEVYQSIGTRESIEYAEEALQIADSLNLHAERARALNLLGVAWRNGGNKLKSAELLTEALNIYQQTGSLKGQAEVLRNIGETYRAGDDMAKSVSYLNKALRIFQAENDSAGLAKTYNRLAATTLEIYYWTEDYRKLDTDTTLAADDFLNEVLKNEKLRSKFDSLSMYIDLSLLYAEKLHLTDVRISSEILKSALYSSNHNYEKALSGYYEVLNVIEKSGTLFELPLALYNIANLYYRVDRIDDAIEIGERGCTLAAEQDINTYVLLISEMLHKLFVVKKDYQKAYKYLLMSIEAQNKFMKSDIDLRIKSVQSDHEIAEKEFQILGKKKMNQTLIGLFSLIIIVIFGFTILLIRKNKKQTLLNSDLQKKNLIISEKNRALAITNTEKDKFFSILAHDVRGPLSSFIGLTEYINDNLDKISPADLKDFINKMNISARNLYELLSNLLDWSRMQSGIIVYSPGNFILKELATVSLYSVTDAAHKKSVEIVTDIPEDITVFADSNMLMAVLRNLLSNAVKFTAPRGKVTLKARNVEDDKVEILVEDTGVGIPEDIIANLFTLNGGTSRTGTEGEQSNGLGLLICKDFIERHKGKIAVESVAGHGSTFRVTLDSTGEKR